MGVSVSRCYAAQRRVDKDSRACRARSIKWKHDTVAVVIRNAAVIVRCGVKHGKMGDILYRID